MGMKKALALLLAIAILLPCLCIDVNAEEQHTFCSVRIDAGNGTVCEKVVIQDGEIYIPAAHFSRYTRFAYDEETHLFLVKGQEMKKAFKFVQIDVSKKGMFVSGKSFFALSDCFEAEGELYLPLCQMLPVLNADIYEVKDNVICIANNQLSLAEVLYNFDISDYYFNMSAEFYDMDWAALLTVVPNYVWDTVVNGRFDRLDVLFDSGEYNDYKDAFSDFLSDDNLYLKAMAQDASVLDSVVDFFGAANDTAKKLKSVYGWVEAAGEANITSQEGGKLLDALKTYYDSGALNTDDLKGINDAWSAGDLSFGDCVEILTYVYTYATQVEDNRHMLDAVYNVESAIVQKETARKAAKQVYDLYGKNVIPALCKEIATNVAGDTIQNLSPIGIYTATAKVAGTIIESLFVPYEPGDVAKLPVYSDIVLTALSKYRSKGTATDEDTQDLRLSLLLCMIASKKCYEIMADVFAQDKSYYEGKISEIERMIMGLYIVADNVTFDSVEHFEEYRETNLKKIADGNVTGNAEEYRLSEEEALEIAKDLISRYESYSAKGFVCDVDENPKLSADENEQLLDELSPEWVDALAGGPERSLCCSTSKEAEAHLHECIDASLAPAITQAYVATNDALYFFWGAKGHPMYRTTSLVSWDNQTIVAIADFYVGYTYCGTHTFTLAKDKQFKIVAVTEEVKTIDLNGTYWSITFGQTAGTQYVAQFRPDGTILALGLGSNQFSNGTYQYTNGLLTVTLDSFKETEFMQTSTGFRSTQKHPMQIGDGYYTISQTDGDYFLQHYEDVHKEKQLTDVKKAFPDCSMSTQSYTSNAGIIAGRYLGPFDNIDDGCAYITLRDNYTFSIQTNIDLCRYTPISPVSFEGTYVVYKRAVTYPDNTTEYSTALILFFEDYQLAWYEVEERYFGDQVSGFTYVGKEI